MAEPGKSNILRSMILAIVIAAIMILIPQAIGYGKAAFAQTGILNQFLVYEVTGIIFLVILIGIFFTEILIKKGDEKYGNSIAFASQGEVTSPGFLKKYSTFQLFMFFLVIFLVIGFFNFLTKQTNFTGVGSLEEQFTPVDNLLFSAALVPAAENLGLALVIALMLFGLRFLARKLDWSKTTFILTAFFIIVLMGGVYGAINHQLRYASSDVSIQTVFIFWSIGAFLTLLTGNFIPFWTMHLVNNLFVDLKSSVFAKDIVVASVVGSIIVLIVIYILLYIVRKKKTEVQY